MLCTPRSLDEGYDHTSSRRGHRARYALAAGDHPTGRRSVPAEEQLGYPATKVRGVPPLKNQEKHCGPTGKYLRSGRHAEDANSGRSAAKAVTAPDVL